MFFKACRFFLFADPAGAHSIIMFTYNITFVTSPDMEEKMVVYLKNTFLPQVINSRSEARHPELKKIVEAGGEKPDPEHGVSVALSATFPSKEAAHKWHDDILLPALGEFHSAFGTHAVFFITLLEKIGG